MRISDSNPVQFWINGEETYNEKETPGITKVCWCQGFECDDEIKVAFIDANVADHSLFVNLLAKDESDAVLATIPFVVNHIDKSINTVFIPRDYDLCDKSFSLQVVYDYVSLRSILDPSTFTNISDGFTAWTISSHTSITYFSVFNQSNRLHIPISLPFSANITVLFNISASFGSVSHMTGVFRKAGIEVSNTVTFNTNNISNISYQDFMLTDTPDELVIKHTIIATFAGPPTTFTIQDIEIYETTPIEYGHSDCINISEANSARPTILIAYSNNSAFDGINFQDTSPSDLMYLRIPGIFFHLENPVVQEDIELSDSNIVRLYNKIEEKRLLQIGMMPPYMHRKLILALSSDTVLIDDSDWLLRDEYNKPQGNLKYPLKTATVLLTDKRFLKENQLS